MIRNAVRRRFSVAASSPLSLPSISRPYFDFKALVNRAEYLEANARSRAVSCDVEKLTGLFREWTAAQSAVDAVRAQRNAVSKSGDASSVSAGRALRVRMSELEAVAAAARESLDAAAVSLPNDTHPASPLGSEASAVEIGRIGAPRVFDFKPQSHLAIGARLGLFDWTGAVAAAGAGFSSLSDDGVMLELAIVQWALARASAAGFSLRAPPDVARREILEGCGFAPRNGGVSSAPQIYALPDDGLALVGTAEVPLAALRAGTLLDARDAAAGPSLYAAWGHCFRREAGGAGAATRGLYRLHQFTKVELFAFVAPTLVPPPAVGFAFPQIAAALSSPPSAARSAALPRGGLQPSAASEAIFSRLVDFQASLISELGLSARVLDMPSEELGASAFRKVDIEVWMPAREAKAGGPLGSWGEVSSASNCLDFQARRLGMRYRTSPKAGDVGFLHTLNATAAAVPRLILSILETHQTRDGDVIIPPCLSPYLGGKTMLRAPAGAAAQSPFGGPSWSL